MIKNIKPILRWAGGKSHFTSELLSSLPKDWNRYIEPMFGGGALFFSLCPQNALLSDINSELITFYKMLRDHKDELIKRLFTLKASRDTYYELRSMNPIKPMDRAVRFAYLNRLCWNGLYRVNKSGKFNVPIGSRLPKILWDRQRLLNASNSLKSAELREADFAEILEEAGRNDLVFLDPPYPRGATGNNGFDRYSSVKFSLNDHNRLAQSIRSIDNRGARIILTLSSDPIITKIYPNFLRSSVIVAKSLISGRNIGRRFVREEIRVNFSN